jgi:hypothetical protein
LKIRFEMVARDMLPDALNAAYERARLSHRVEATENILLFRDVDWEAVPQVGDEVDAGVLADSRKVERVLWRSDGLPIVSVGDFDTDEVGTDRVAPRGGLADRRGMNSSGLSRTSSADTEHPIEPIVGVRGW